jgi:hypothetical protein
MGAILQPPHDFGRGFLARNSPKNSPCTDPDALLEIVWVM